MLLAACLMGCAGDLVAVDDGPSAMLESRKHGYRIANLAAAADPSGSAPSRIDLEGADLAYRDAEGSIYSLGTRCRKTQAPVGVLARHLTIGTSRDALLAAGPVELRGDPGWSQTFDSREGELLLRIKAITLTGGRCVYDWLLVSLGPEAFERAEPRFDDWWRSFERERSDAEASESAPAKDDPS
jgi:hypothetical protein